MNIATLEYSMFFKKKNSYLLSLFDSFFFPEKEPRATKTNHHRRGIKMFVAMPLDQKLFLFVPLPTEKNIFSLYFPQKRYRKFVVITIFLAEKRLFFSRLRFPEKNRDFFK